MINFLGLRRGRGSKVAEARKGKGVDRGENSGVILKRETVEEEVNEMKKAARPEPRPENRNTDVEDGVQVRARIHPSIAIGGKQRLVRAAR